MSDRRNWFERNEWFVGIIWALTPAAATILIVLAFVNLVARN